MRVKLLENFDGFTMEGRCSAIILYRNRQLIEGSGFEEQIRRARLLHAVLADRRWTRRESPPN